MVQPHKAKETNYLLPIKTLVYFMVDGKLKTYRLHTPPFCFGCRDFVNSSTAKRNATFTVHTHIHMYATLLNDELMNKTKNITQTFHTMSEQVILY